MRLLKGLSMTRSSAVCAFLISTSSCLAAGNYVISTFAGGAPQTTPMAATSASIGSPTGAATDAAGNVFFTGDQCVFKMDLAGVLTRVAGNARAGYSGDGGPAAEAQLNGPYGLVLDAGGNLYIADTYNYRIRKVSADGMITTVAGTGVDGYSGDGGPALQAQLGEVVAIAIDGAGNLFLDDLFSAIRKVSAAGLITTIAQNGGPAVNGQSNLPMGVAADAAGNVYVADTYKLIVRRISPAGVVTVIAGTGAFGSGGDGGPATQARLNSPDAIAVDASGNIYIGSGLNWQIRKVSPDGIISTLYPGDAAQGTSGASVGIAADNAGNVYMTDYIRDGVRKFAPNGTWAIVAGNGNFSFSGDGGPATKAQLFLPSATAIDGGHNIYIADTQNGRVRKISPDGVITTVAGNGVYGDGGDGGPAVNAQIYRPLGVAVDQAGNVYFTDANNSRIRKISTSGIITTFAGSETGGYSGDGGPASAAQFTRPWGLAFDSAGDLFVADFGNQRVRRISANGTVNTIAGSGVVGSAGVGGPALSAQLTTPYSVAVDGAGNAYIFDQAGYGRALKVFANGTLTQLAGSADIGGPLRSRQTTYVNAIAADAAGNVFFTDSYNYRVREISPDGSITTIAGNEAPGYSGDGGFANRAQLLDPVGLAVDGEGGIYVADSSNDAIRILQPRNAVRPRR